MMEAPFTILGIAGSLRSGSVNRALLRAAQEVAPDGVSLEIFEGLREIPPFSEDDEGDRTPQPVLDFGERIRGADALLLATPEYNGSIPGVLKNAIDWASRPRGACPLDDKAAAVIGASPGRFGAAKAQADLRRVLAASKARVLDAEFPVGQAAERFDGDGRLIDDVLRRELGAFVYGRMVSRVCNPWPISLMDLALEQPQAA